MIYVAIFFFLSAFISFLAEQLDSDVLERIRYDDFTVYICINIQLSYMYIEHCKASI